jgi:exodeoxyribonuclease V alpha subunit
MVAGIQPQAEAAPRPAESVVSGTVQRIYVKQEDTGFTVLVIKERDNRPLTLVGTMPAVHEGEYVTAQGRMVTHPVRGDQFRVSGYVAEPPIESEAMEHYLASGLIKGIGPKLAKSMVQKFGSGTFHVIETTPERLKEIEGLGKKRIGSITEAWRDHKEVHEIMAFLSRRGLTANRAHRIYEHYKDQRGGIIKILENEPYALTEIRGIGFAFADSVAKTLGISDEDPRRLAAGVRHVLHEQTKQGHCGVPFFDFIDAACRLLNAARGPIRRAIQEETERESPSMRKDNIDGNTCLFTVQMHDAEEVIAERLLAMKTGPHPCADDKDIGASITRVESETRRTLSGSQREAVIAGLTNKVQVITGGPGVGKTTTLDTLLRIIADHRPGIRLCAPTGQAAKRMGKQTGYPAVTIHRLIGASRRRESDADAADDGGDEDVGHRKETDLKTCDLLVIDESSMIDVRLMAQLLKAVPERAAVLIVGDIDQLPSVGAGAVLRDLIASGAIAVARLTDIFRQAAGSRIITNAHRINRGEMPLNAAKGEQSDFFFWPSKGPEECADAVMECVMNRIPKQFGMNPKTDIQVLAPMKSSAVGTRNLNVTLQQALLPRVDPKLTFAAQHWTFQVGDKVMQTSNNYDKGVFNGDLGYVTAIDNLAKTAVIAFDQGDVSYALDDLYQVMPAYAVTIHKSQGSEFPAVVIPMMNQHYVMLSRNLLYTGVTRGRSLVVLIGQEQAIKRAVENNDQSKRWTRLRQLLAQTPPVQF